MKQRGRPKGRSRDTRSFGPLGDLIRTNRLNKGLGLADVAKACSCSVQFISNIEHGRAPLPWEKVPLMASFLKIPIEDLQAANLAIRSDFKSFVTTAGVGLKRPKPAILNGAASAANAFAATVKDSQLREVIAAYQTASTSDRRKFYKAALRMLG